MSVFWNCLFYQYIAYWQPKVDTLAMDLAAFLPGQGQAKMVNHEAKFVREDKISKIQFKTFRCGASWSDWPTCLVWWRYGGIFITFQVAFFVTFFVTLLINFLIILCMHRLSTSVAKRFPTFHHLVIRIYIAINWINFATIVCSVEGNTSQRILNSNQVFLTSRSKLALWLRQSWNGSSSWWERWAVTRSCHWWE